MNGVDIGEALVAIVRNLSPGASLLFTLFCWIAGFCLLLWSGFRLVRMASDRMSGPSGAGTVMTVVGSVVMFTFPVWLDAGGLTVFGYLPDKGTAVLGYGDKSRDYEEVLWAVFQVVRAIGAIGVVKGVFVLRDAGDGRNGATTGKGLAHLGGGMAGWHILAVLDALQSTLGIEPLKILGVSGPSPT